MDEEAYIQVSGDWYQQGDVTIKPVDQIPGDAKPTDNCVLAEGEATGHKHVAEATDVRLFVHDGKLFMRAPSGTTIVHQEHHSLHVPPGDYVIGIVREYDHFAEQEHDVMD